MIEGGGLGIYSPKEVGPMMSDGHSIGQVPNGVVDILVKDEAEATAVAKHYLSYFQTKWWQTLDSEGWSCDDQRKLRNIIPENRRFERDLRTIYPGSVERMSLLRPPGVRSPRADRDPG